MKILCRVVPLFLLALLLSACGVLSTQKKKETSSLKIEDIQGQLRLGMSYDNLLDLTKITPDMKKKRAAVFNMLDGELWVRFSGTEQKIGDVIFWGTLTRLPNGKTVKKTSKKQALDKMQNNPICIDININTNFNGQKRLGKCYYEQYGAENILVEASEKGKKSRKVSLVFINGKYVLQKGNIPKGSEFKYLAGYMANLKLMQRLLARGMKEATPVENGRSSFFFESKTVPFVIKILNKKIVYPAPWVVEGYVEPKKSEKAFDFNINFTVNWKTEKDIKIQDTNFSGTFRQKQKKFGEDIILPEWKQFLMVKPGTLTPLQNPKIIFEDLL